MAVPGFHALTLFAVLLTALPIILHLSTPQSYRLALAVAVVLALPSLLELFPGRSWRNLLALAGVTILVAAPAGSDAPGYHQRRYGSPRSP